MSKCNRMKKQMTLPAFDIKPIDDHTVQHGFDTPARSAAEAQAISDILPHICLGSWRDAEDAEVVVKKGITHVLNVAKECPSLKEQEAMDRVEVVKRQIPLVDAHSENILPHFEEAFMFIDEARSKGGRVLVHCRRGISRSPAIVTGYIMTKTGTSYESALNFVTSCRSSVSLNLAFREILFTYKPQVKTPDQQIHQILLSSPVTIHTSGSGTQVNTAPLLVADATPGNSQGSDVKSMMTTGSSSNNQMGITPASEGEENNNESPSPTPNGDRSAKVGFGDDDAEDEEDEPSSSGAGKGGASF